jgi:hypothetical protein
MNRVISDIAELAAACYDANYSIAYPYASANLQRIGAIASQGLTGEIRTKIKNILCSNFSAVVVAERIVQACNAATKANGPELKAKRLERGE